VASKDGWYALSTAGALCSGPFPTHVACKAHIAQERADINTLSSRRDKPALS
jgi:hypothetical protein